MSKWVCDWVGECEGEREEERKGVNGLEGYDGATRHT